MDLDEEDLDLSGHSGARVGVDELVGQRVHGDVDAVSCDDLGQNRVLLKC